MSRLPLSATQAAEADAQRYLDALADALEGGRILGGEAQILARLAGSVWLDVAQVAALHGRFLQFLRSAALADAILTTAEIRQLRTTAQALGLPDYFADLKPIRRPISPQRGQERRVAARPGPWPGRPAPRRTRPRRRARRRGRAREDVVQVAGKDAQRRPRQLRDDRP